MQQAGQTVFDSTSGLELHIQWKYDATKILLDLEGLGKMPLFTENYLNMQSNT
jgi:hypothetical protein